MDALCRGLPDEFILALEYVRSLSFSETPDYEYLKNMFIQLYEGFYGDDFLFDASWFPSRELLVI